MVKRRQTQLERGEDKGVPKGRALVDDAFLAFLQWRTSSFPEVANLPRNLSTFFVTSSLTRPASCFPEVAYLLVCTSEVGFLRAFPSVTS